MGSEQVGHRARGGTKEGFRVGEVRVAVRLTNLVDEADARRNMIHATQIRTYEADALVDTGAVRPVFAGFCG